MTELSDILGYIRSQKTVVANAEADLCKAVRDGIKAALIEAFENPDVRNVVFGVSTQPYNDENMGAGTFGPVANAIEDYGSVADDYHVFYDLFAYGDKGSSAEVRQLGDVLRTAEWIAVGDALGMDVDPGEPGGGEEILFIAERSDAPGGYTLIEHRNEY